MNATLRPGLAQILGARSAAVVGASDRRPVHTVAIDNLRRASSKVWGIHPRRREVNGMECFPNVGLLPEVPDLALMLVGPGNVVAAAEEMLAAGVPALVVPGLGAEAGAAGRSIAAEVVALCERHGAALVGVNCMGVVVPGGLSPWIGTLGVDLREGAIAAVVQSGSVGEALAALGPRVGFRCIASVGAESNRDVADWVGYLAEDEGTSAIALFLESVRRPAALKAAFEKAAAAGKPIVCLRVGRSEAGAQATIAHTDAVLTPARAFAAVARDVGLIEVGDFAEMVEALELLGSRTPISGVRLAAVTQSGGEAALLADIADQVGVEMPQFSPELNRRLEAVLPPDFSIGNPLDAWTIDETAAVYRGAFEALVQSGEFDLVLVQMDMTPFIGQMEATITEAVCEALLAAGDGRTATAVLSGQSSEPLPEVRRLAVEYGAPLLRSARPALRALALVGGWSPRPGGDGSAEGRPELDLPAGGMGELEAAEVLKPFGIKFARALKVTDFAEAREAADSLGYPVVLKRDVPGHKAAEEGVVLGIDSAFELESAMDKIGTPAILAKQLPAGPEVYCGASNHAGFGSILCVGWGGVTLGAESEIACSIVPIDQARALQLIREVPGLSASVSDGLELRLAQTLTSIGEVAHRLPVGASLDVNPLILSERAGPVAVDALINFPGGPAAPPA